MVDMKKEEVAVIPVEEDIENLLTALTEEAEDSQEGQALAGHIFPPVDFWNK